MNSWLKDGERVDDLIHGGMKIIQNPALPSFAIDAVLLAAFAGVKKGEAVIDLGTGTGAVPLLLAGRGRAEVGQNMPGAIWGIEIKPELADMASRSVVLNNLQDQVQIIEGDLREAPVLTGRGKFGLVTVNPPYQPQGSGDVSPLRLRASARHELNCSLEEVAASAAALLQFGGRFCLVHRPERLADIFVACRKVGLEPKKMRLVHPYLGKKANLVLVEAKKGGKAGLDALPPLVVYSEKGKYSKEILEIYFGSDWEKRV